MGWIEKEKTNSILLHVCSCTGFQPFLRTHFKFLKVDKFHTALYSLLLSSVKSIVLPLSLPDYSVFFILIIKKKVAPYKWNVIIMHWDNIISTPGVTALLKQNILHIPFCTFLYYGYVF